MNPLVHRTLVAQIRTGDTDRYPVLAHLGYDPADPFAVTVVFSHDGRVLARWCLDREMLAEGLRRPAGVGDVRLRPQSQDSWEELRMELYGDARSGGGRHHAVIHLWAPALESFLRRTHEVVPPGQEDTGVDALISELTAGR